VARVAIGVAGERQDCLLVRGKDEEASSSAHPAQGCLSGIKSFYQEGAWKSIIFFNVTSFFLSLLTKG
jgi:hypothetical protein